MGHRIHQRVGPRAIAVPLQPRASPGPAPCGSSAAAPPRPQLHALPAASARTHRESRWDRPRHPASTRCPRVVFPAVNPPKLHRHHHLAQQSTAASAPAAQTAPACPAARSCSSPSRSLPAPSAVPPRSPRPPLASRLHRGRRQVLALGRRHRLQRCHIHARLLRERRCRRPVGTPFCTRSSPPAPPPPLPHPFAASRLRNPHRQPPRRRKTLARNTRSTSRSRSSSASTRRRNSACAPAIIRAGTSSNPISKRKSMCSYRSVSAGVDIRSTRPEIILRTSMTSVAQFIVKRLRS